jgi:hypothetical protein
VISSARRPWRVRGCGRLLNLARPFSPVAASLSCVRRRPSAGSPRLVQCWFPNPCGPPTCVNLPGRAFRGWAFFLLRPPSRRMIPRARLPMASRLHCVELLAPSPLAGRLSFAPLERKPPVLHGWHKGRRWFTERQPPRAQWAHRLTVIVRTVRTNTITPAQL